MKQIRKRLTYANVMSSLAMFLMLGGATAFAATKIGANELKANSVITGKIKKEAVTGGKIKNSAVTEGKLGNGSVTSEKLADNAVTTSKIANEAVNAGKLGANSVTGPKIAANSVNSTKITNDAVTSEKLAPNERSEAFEVETATSSAELAEPLASAPTQVQTLNLPAGGTYVVTAQAELTLTIGEPVFTECFLSDDGASIAEMSDSYQAGLFFPAGGVSMTGIADGGTVALSCKSNDEKTFASHRHIVAVRVGSQAG